MDEAIQWAKSLSTPGGNPFASAAQHYRNLNPFIDPPAWYLVNTALLGVLLIVSAILHLCGIILPCSQGRESRAKHLWLARRKYVNGRRRYWIPNGRFVSSIASLACAIVLASMSAIAIWYWLVTFDVLFADALCHIWSHESTKTRKRLILDALRHPFLMNSLCWGVTLLFIIWQSVVVAIASSKFMKFRREAARCLAALDVAAAEFDASGKTDFVDLLQLFEQAQSATQAFRRYLQWGRILFKGFAVCFLVCASVFGGALVLLARTVRRSTRHKAVTCTSLPIASSASLPASIPIAVVNDSKRATVAHAASMAPCEPWVTPQEWNSLSPDAAVLDQTHPVRAHRRSKLRRQRDRKRRQSWQRRSLAVFLTVHSFLLCWVTIGLFVFRARLDDIMRDMALLRKCVIALNWPINLTLLLMGIIGIHRILETRGSGPLPPADVDSHRPVDPSRRPKPRRQDSSYVGLFTESDEGSNGDRRSSLDTLDAFDAMAANMFAEMAEVEAGATLTTTHTAPLTFMR